MRATVMTAFGPPEVLKMQTVPDPVPGDDDLLIEVYATSVNPIDYKVRRETYGPPRQLPSILGFDVSGVVRGMGKNVTRWKVGDEVYASPSIARPGADAELVCVDARSAAAKPATLPHFEAAALPLVTLTAWESLHKRAAIHRDETVLIHAGAGGVGHIAIQLAKNAGCKVITTAGRPDSIAMCLGLGADIVIDHSKEDFVLRVQQETGGKGCPVVFDTVGGEVFDKSLECVGLNGRLVTIVFNQSTKIVPALFRKNATLHCEFMGVPTIHGVNPGVQGQILHTVAELVDAGKLKPHISHTIALEELREGHRLQESQRTMGKIAVKVR